jgi:hypothetical protein
MKVFKQLFRSASFVALVGGWTVSAAALHLVRTPSNSFPVILTKDHLGFRDTYVDTRKWTIADDAAHPIVVARLIQLGRADLLGHTVNTSAGPVSTQLATAIQSPTAAPATTPDLVDKAKAELKNVTDTVKSKIN